MRRLFAAGCAAYAAAWLWAVRELPERVPLHFGVDGQVDRWGDRGTALVLFALLGGGVATILWLLLRRVAGDHLAGVNTPHKAWWLQTAERRARFRTLVAQDLAGIGAGAMLLLAGALLAVTSAATGPEPALPGWFPLLLAAFLAGVLAWTAWSYLGRYRPDRGASG